MLPAIPKISQISPGIVRILGMNPSPMTLQGTNSYLIGTPKSKKRLLIDTSNPGRMDYVETVRQYLQEQCDNRPIISDIIITHWHPDHIGAVPDILKVAESLQWSKPKVHKFPHESIIEAEMEVLKDNQIMDLSQFGMGSLQIVFTPGHTSDHVCLLLRPEDILFSGDLILGHGSTTFEDLSAYMESLRKVQRMGNSLAMILPAHGQEIAQPIAKISEYLQHRLERIHQVQIALSASEWQSEIDIVGKVYDSSVIDNPMLLRGALKNQYEALKYLLKEGSAAARDCTEEEKMQQKLSLSEKMWRSTEESRTNL